MASIFQFTDYREYLKAYFAERKKSDRTFSHRWIARQLDISTSNFLWLVMQGRRNLKPGICLKISELFKHSRQEAEYFENMVNFAQAKISREKDLFFRRMAALRKELKIETIEEWQYEYYTNWYNPVIRELVTSPAFDGDPATLSSLLQPSITPRLVKQSIELLLKLKMIKRRAHNRYIQTFPNITTGPEVNSLAVVNFHRAMGNLAVESLDRIPKQERNITASTVFITREMFDTIREKIEEFRKEILRLADTVKQGDRVYQINFQVFPVSKAYRRQYNTPNPSSTRRRD